MSLPTGFIYGAGLLQLLVASANIFAFGKFKYMHHLQHVPVVVRQVFLVQNAYIMLVQLGSVLLCFFFASDLVSGHALGCALSGFFSFFWGSRVLLQLFFYDKELRRANRLFDVMFVLGDGYLATVFGLAALLPTLVRG